MKRPQQFITLVALVLSCFLGSLKLSADTPAYSCEIRNGSFVSSQIFEFDLYLTQVGATSLEISGFNTGILLNTGFVNGGSITPSLLTGTSELNAEQVPVNIDYDAAFRCVKIAPRVPPRNYSTGATSGTIISNTLGTRVCRVRLTNSVDFGSDPLNYTWSMNLMPYHTVVAAFLPGGSIPVNAAITDAASHSKSENLTLFLQGLYVAATGNRKAQDETGDHFAGPVADVITVQLAQADAPHSIVYSTDALLYSNGKCFLTVPGSITDSYYLVVKHRNSIETWSAAPVSFAGGMISYDFSSAASQAYGDNQILSGAMYAIYGGNVAQDNLIDGTDMAAVDNASTGGMIGYINEDANGDGLVDGSDMALIDNNSTASVSISKP